MTCRRTLSSHLQNRAACRGLQNKRSRQSRATFVASTTFSLDAAAHPCAGAILRTALSASILAGLSFAGALYAEEAPAPTQNGAVQTPDAAAPAAGPAAAADDATTSNSTEMETIVVRGIRESLKRSLETKRDADAVVDAITAEDIGKFPSTNVAEAMAQIPGVTIDRRFGQGERVSINGTDPSLNLTFLDGHPVAETTWLYGEQPNRGFDYTLLAPEILGKLEVYKSPEARLPEGSIGGTVIMHTREPLDLPNNTISGSVGVTYGDQSDSTKPNASFLYSGKSADNTFGAAISAQHYEEKVDRQGEEIFGYSPVSSLSASPAVAAGIANGTLNPNDLMPQEINAAYFQQTRKRDSGTINLQWKPSDQLEFDAKGLYIRENFNNFNQSMYGFTSQTPLNITSLTPGGNGLITGGHSCGNDDPTCPGLVANGGNGPVNTYIDNQARTSVVKTYGIDLSGVYHGDDWSLSGQGGYSQSNDTDNRRRSSSRTTTAAIVGHPSRYHVRRFGGRGESGQLARRRHAGRRLGRQLRPVAGRGEGCLRPARLVEDVRQLDQRAARRLPLRQARREPCALHRRRREHRQPRDNRLQRLHRHPGLRQRPGPSRRDELERRANWVLGSPLGNSPDAASFLNNSYALTQTSDAAYAQANFGGTGYAATSASASCTPRSRARATTTAERRVSGTGRQLSDRDTRITTRCRRSTSRGMSRRFRAPRRGRRSHRVGTVQPGSAQHVPQRHRAHGFRRQCES